MIAGDFAFLILMMFLIVVFWSVISRIKKSLNKVFDVADKRLDAWAREMDQDND